MKDIDKELDTQIDEPNLEWVDKIDLLEFWNALDDHFSTELLTDEHAGHIREAIIRCFKRTIATKLAEAYKKGFIDGTLEEYGDLLGELNVEDSADRIAQLRSTQ